MFISLGLFTGNHGFPERDRACFGTVLACAVYDEFFYIAFAFSGWNAAVYAVEEFKRPKRDVPRAMFVGCCAVALVYLLVNWIFVAIIGPEQASVVFTYEAERVTLGHVVMTGIIGAAGGNCSRYSFYARAAGDAA